jgi:hypothetical protein
MDKEKDRRYELLLQCWLSDQMTLPQLTRHLEEDTAFADWFTSAAQARIRQRGP